MKFPKIVAIRRKGVAESYAALFILLSAFSLAYANGANDNFKGVATLFSSGITNYRRALVCNRDNLFRLAGGHPHQCGTDKSLQWQGAYA